MVRKFEPDPGRFDNPDYTRYLQQAMGAIDLQGKKPGENLPPEIMICSALGHLLRFIMEDFEKEATDFANFSTAALASSDLEASANRSTLKALQLLCNGTYTSGGVAALEMVTKILIHIKVLPEQDPSVDRVMHIIGMYTESLKRIMGVLTPTTFHGTIARQQYIKHLENALIKASTLIAEQPHSGDAADFLEDARTWNRQRRTGDVQFQDMPGFEPSPDLKDKRI